MNQNYLEESIIRGPESFEEVIAQKQEFLCCASNITLSSNYKEQKYYTDRLQKIIQWCGIWPYYTTLEINRKMREIPATIILTAPMKETDPAYWMLEEGLKDPEKRSKSTVYKDDCYICNDPEFALMGLPLCYPCKSCGGHVAADDSRCDNCGLDQD